MSEALVAAVSEIRHVFVMVMFYTVRILGSIPAQSALSSGLAEKVDWMSRALVVAMVKFRCVFLMIIGNVSQSEDSELSSILAEKMD